MQGRNNAYDFLRLLLALFVFISHGYVLKGLPYKDIEPYILHQTNLGQLGILGFFSLSGYLVTKSYVQTKNAVQFLLNRITRIFPAYWACLIITAFIIAPLIYFLNNDSFKNYPVTGSAGALSYIKTNFFLRMNQISIVHVLDNTYFKHVNISLWTLFQEFKYYCLTLLLGLSGLLYKKKFLLLTVIILFVFYVLSKLHNTYFDFSFHTHINYLLIAYLTGVIFYTYHDFFTERAKVLCIVLVIMLVISSVMLKLILILPVAFGMLILLLFGSFKITVDIDLSYGIYLYSFPIQLIIFLGYNEWSLLGLLIASIGVILVFAFLSFHLIESPALKLKHIFAKWLSNNGINNK
jgi:peptidoglycan/LPS O-acetylase OafA/YrhL